MKTNELTGEALDWAVAKCECIPVEKSEDGKLTINSQWDYWFPSSDWSQGGAIVERERICLIDQGGDYWQAICGWKEAFGDTPLIAAMRCYVASKLGDEIEVPDEIVNYA